MGFKAPLLIRQLKLAAVTLNLSAMQVTAMVAVLPQPDTSLAIVSRDRWLNNPTLGTEWVDGQIIQKTGMTLQHSKVQSRLSTLWRQFKDASDQGGEVYTEAPCRTKQQGRSPDVAYLTPALVSEHGNAKALPQSFPLCAEIVSPTDFGEDVIAKAQEYLASGGEEVWLVFPEVRWIIVVTAEQRLVFASGQIAKTQRVLEEFEIAIDELMA